MAGIRSEQIYEALTDDSAFAQLPSLIADAGGGRSAMIIWSHLDGAVEVAAHKHFTPAFLKDYAAATDLDPWVSVTRQIDANWNHIVALDNWVSDTRFRNSGIYNEVIRSHGDDTFRCIGGVFSSAWGTAHLGVHRGRNSKPFEAENCSALECSVRHLERVLIVRGELAAARRAAGAARAALDDVGLVVVTLGGDGRIIELNARAAEATSRGNYVQSRNGRLVAVSDVDGPKLAQAIQRATSRREPASSTVLIHGRAASPVVATVTPMPVSGAPGRALLVYREPSADDTAAIGQLRQLFGLTRSEAAVAVDVARGLTPAQIVLKRGVTANTVKSQLRAAMSKTGASRQLELALLIG